MAERAGSLACAAALLLAGCGERSGPGNVTGVGANAQRASGPIEAAQQLVRRRLGGEVRFSEARVYRSGNVAVVCGTYSQPGAASRRYVAVSDTDVWLEPEMAGEMDRAFAEFCRDRAANA